MKKTELNSLVIRAQRGDVGARNELVERNVGLVLRFTGKAYYYDQNNIEDYFQEGIIGLMRAIETYEPARQLQFSTYAVWWIKQGMQRYRYNTTGIIRIPVYAQDIRRQFEKLLGERPRLGKEGIIKLVARINKRSVESVKELVDLDLRCGTLNKPNENGDEMEVEQPFMGTITGIERMDLDYLMTQLTFREYRLIQKRVQGMTLLEIAEQEGVSRERIRQICEGAITQMQTLHNLRRMT